MNLKKDTLFASLKVLQQEFEDQLPPVERWHPDLNGDLDMRIDREGRWYYQESLVQREAMVRLFSSILKREGDAYFLVTPVEKWRIQVDEAPFVFVALRQEEEAGVPVIILTTNTGHDVLLSEANPFWMDAAANGEPRPMALVYRDLPGLLNRNLFYQLVEMCEENASGELVFSSAGRRFVVGRQ